MKVLTYDPYVSSAQAHKLGVELVDLDEIIENPIYLCAYAPDGGDPSSYWQRSHSKK